MKIAASQLALPQQHEALAGDHEAPTCIKLVGAQLARHSQGTPPSFEMIVKGPSESVGQSHLLGSASTTETAVPLHDPPEYISQSQFHVGKAVTLTPFVTPSQSKIHLGLLRAFRKLKFQVQEGSDIASAFPPLAATLDAEARWIWFLELALER